MFSGSSCLQGNTPEGEDPTGPQGNANDNKGHQSAAAGLDSDTTQSADGAETDEEETQSLCSDDEEVLLAEDDTTQTADGAETDEEETQSLCSDDEEVLQAEDAGPGWGAAPAEAAEAAAAEVVSVVANLGEYGVQEARARYRDRRAREMIEAGQRQGAGCRLVLCPQDAHLDTVWIAAVSVAIFLLHAEGDRGQKMRECAKELDCIAKQNPMLLFFAVVCPDAGWYLNHNLWVGGAPNNVVLISFEELLGELAQDLSLPTKQFHYLLHNMTCPHGIELAVLTRHLLTACANFRGMLSRLKIGHLFFADTNDFFTRQAIQRMLVLQEPFVQLVDDAMEETNAARVLGGGLRVKASNLVAYAEALRHACNYLFQGCELLDGRPFSAEFRKNLSAHQLVVDGTFTIPVNLKSRLFVDQVVQGFALQAVTSPGCYTEIRVCWAPGGWTGTNGQFVWLQDVVVSPDGTAAPPEGDDDSDNGGGDDSDSDDDFDHEKMDQSKQQQRAAVRKKRMKRMYTDEESEDARLALCRVQKKISRDERLDCANRIRAAVATEAALAQNDELPPQCETHAQPDEAQPQDGDWNDELQEGESAAGRLTRLEDAGQLHRLSRWEKHQLMADMFPE